jgi:hypothetical protein
MKLLKFIGCLLAATVLAKEVVISWPQNNEAKNYIVSYKEKDSFKTNSTTATNIVLNLAANTDYLINVQAIKSNGVIVPVKTVFFNLAFPKAKLDGQSQPRPLIIQAYGHAE